MRVLIPSRSEFLSSVEVVQIIDHGRYGDAPATFFPVAVHESIGYIRTNGTVPRHRGYSYEWSERDCCFVTLATGEVYLSSREGLINYLRSTGQPGMVELDDL
jgi:hypothetical protein